MQILSCLFALTFTVLLLYTTINAEVRNLPEHGKIIEVLHTGKAFLSSVKISVLITRVFFKILGLCYLDTFGIN